MRVEVVSENGFVETSIFGDDEQLLDRHELARYMPTCADIYRKLGIRALARDNYHIGIRVELSQFREVQVEDLVKALCELIANNVNQYRNRSQYSVLVPNDNLQDIRNIEPHLEAGIPPRFIIGNKVYRLVPTNDAESTALLTDASSYIRHQSEQLREVYQSMTTQVQEEVSRRVAEVEERFRQANLMPLVTLRDAQLGMQAWVENGTPYISLPFTYAPKYIVNDAQRKVIPPVLAAQMVRKVMIVFMLRAHTIGVPALLDPDTRQVFGHYHRRCWGTWEVPPRVEFPDGLYSIRDELQVVIEIINYASPANSHPSNLPEIDMVWEQSLPGTVPTWPLVEPEVEQPQPEPRRWRV